GPVNGQHQAGIERATEWGPATRQLGQDRAVEALDELVGCVIRQVFEWAVCPHPARIRPDIEIAEPLVVAREGQGECLLAVAERDQTRLTSLESLLDEDGALADLCVDRPHGLVDVVADGDPLAGGQAVSLDDDALALRCELARELDGGSALGDLERRRSGHRHARRDGDVVAERLARFDAGGGGGRAEHRDPVLVERIDDAGSQRRLGGDHGELCRDGLGDEDDPFGVEGVEVLERAHARLGPDRVAPGRDGDLVHTRFDAELPGEGMLAGPAADDEDARGHHEPAGGHAGTPWRWRIERQARSIVCVRSGPTETRTIGTAACSSNAVTYRRAFSGRSLSERTSWIGSAHPGNSS